jgi:hypothetical protein
MYLISSNTKIPSKGFLSDEHLIKTVLLISASNEENNFQLVIHPTKDIEDAQIKLELPSSIKNHVEFKTFLVGYRKVQNISTIEEPDLLFDRDTYTFLSSSNNVIGCQLKVNVNAQAGKYIGKLKLKKGDKVFSEMPVEIRILNFELPEKSGLQILAHVRSINKIRNQKYFYKNLKQHGINGVHGYPFPKYGVKFDKAINNYEPFLSFLFNDLSFEFTRLPNIFIGTKGIEENRWNNIQIFHQGTLTNEFKTKYVDYINGLLQFYSKNGWLQKVQIKIIDEPGKKHFVESKEIYRLLKEKFPSIPIEITRGPYKEYSGVIDIWNQNPRHYKEEERDLIKSKGGKVTLYYNKLFEITQPILSPRLLGWILWRYNLDGYYFYSVNDLSKCDISSPCNSGNHFCNGCLLYQDNAGNLVNSIRWEQFKKGMDDYKYLRRLEEKIKTSTNIILATKAKQVLDSVKKKISLNDINIKTDEIETFKKEIGELIEKL